jgi:hypothetical protein
VKKALQHRDAQSSELLVHTILDCYNLPCLLGYVANLMQVCYARDYLHVSVDMTVISVQLFMYMSNIYNLMPSYISPSDSSTP